MNGVYRSVRIYAIEFLQQVRRKGRVFQPGCDFSVQAERRANAGTADNVTRDAIAGIAVGQVDQRHTAAKQAGAAPDGQAVAGGPVKPETRHDQLVAVQVEGVVKAIACGKIRIAGNRAAVVVLFKAHTEFKRQVIPDSPFILHKNTVSGQGEFTNCVNWHTGG